MDALHSQKLSLTCHCELNMFSNTSRFCGHDGYRQENILIAPWWINCLLSSRCSIPMKGSLWASDTLNTTSPESPWTGSPPAFGWSSCTWIRLELTGQSSHQGFMDVGEYIASWTKLGGIVLYIIMCQIWEIDCNIPNTQNDPQIAIGPFWRHRRMHCQMSDSMLWNHDHLLLHQTRSPQI